MDRWVLKISGEKATLTSILAGVPVVMVTTIGARSGLPHTSPLLPVPHPLDPAAIALIATNWGKPSSPAWYYNLRKNSQATCRMNGQDRVYMAHEAEGQEYEQIWACATDMYFGYALYKGRAGRRIPIVVLRPLQV